MGVSRSDECAERVLAIVQPRYLVKLAVAGAVCMHCIYVHCINHARGRSREASRGALLIIINMAANL